MRNLIRALGPLMTSLLVIMPGYESLEEAANTQGSFSAKTPAG
jgi:hypothetical protein